MGVAQFATPTLDESHANVHVPASSGRALTPSLRSMFSFEVEAVIHEYHVYKEIWTPSIGEELIFAREPAKPRDPFAVAVVKNHVHLLMRVAQGLKF